MAKVDGPLMSFGASGSIAKTITFSRWKGRPYVRQHVIPSNPKSPTQTSVRAIWKFLSQAWAAIGATEQATWQTQADALIATPFNAYMKNNVERWKQFDAPGQSYPVPGTGTPPTLAVPTATGGVGQITITYELTAPEDNWGLLLFRDIVTGFTPSFSNLVAAIPASGFGDETYIDSPLQPDEYFYVIRPFSTNGLLGSATAEFSATAT